MKVTIFKKEFLTVLLLFSFQLINSSPCLLAQEITWITSEGTAPTTGISQNEAKAFAIKTAEQIAIEKIVYRDISAETLLVNLRLSGGILGAIPFFSVVEREILEEGVINIHKKGQNTPSSIYRVKIKAAITAETEGIDPDFTLNASLNKTSFKNGNEIQIQILPTKDCYVSIFNILEDEKILRLIPNQYKKRNYLKANEPFKFPDNVDKIKGLTLIAHTPKGKDIVTETIFILALKQPLKLDAEKIQEAVFGIYNGKTAFMNDLIKNIARIPLNERGEKLMQYEIRRK